VTPADRLAAAYTAVLLRHAERAPGRFARVVAGLPVLSLGLPERWANVVLALERPPDPSAVDEALAWLRHADVEGQVLVRQRDTVLLPSLLPVDLLPAYRAPVDLAAGLAGGAAIEVVPATDAAVFARVYEAAFGMRPGLADALVAPADIGATGMTHLLARDGEELVGCALLRPAGGLGYVSAVGVLPERRGRGVGTALLAAGARRAAAEGCDGVWLHASRSSQQFYEGLGYELVDTHVALG
jgi:ribosomal protein S18 acetylase RimI-like enzyme